MFNTDFCSKITKYIEQFNISCPKLMKRFPFAESPGVGIEMVKL